MLQTPFALSDDDYAAFVTRICTRNRWSLAFFKTLDHSERQHWINAEQSLDALLTLFDEKARAGNEGSIEPLVALQILLTRFGYA